MKQFSLGMGLVIFAFMCWRLATSLSSDAMAMGVGVVFGLLAAVPSVLLVLASQRRQSRREDDDDDDYRSYGQRQSLPYQPPIIVLAAPVGDKPQTVNNTYNDNRQVHVGSTMPLLADREREVQAQRGGRVFRVVGEREEGEG